MASEHIIIKRLESAAEDQVSGFRLSETDDQPLKTFIRREAWKSAQASITQTYVAKFESQPQVIAYITLMCAEIKLDDGYSIADKESVNRYIFQPAVRIARLACADGYQRMGLGRKLVELAIGLAKAAIMPNVGCRFIILDAKQKSVEFYQKLGFRLLETKSNRLSHNPVMFMDLRNGG
ncbi:MAG: GNAT family N-acetyltransferase [Pseudomonadota bacterium]